MIQNLDAHITLLYLYRSKIPTKGDLEKIVQGVEHHLTKLVKQPHKLQARFRYHEELATERYAWADLMVYTPLYYALRELENAGLMRRRKTDDKRGIFRKTAFHLSVRPHDQTRIVDMCGNSQNVGCKAQRQEGYSD